MVLPNFVKFHLFVFAYSENLMCLALTIKKFEFWRPRLMGTPYIVVPIHFVKFYVFFALTYCETFISLAQAVKV